MLALLLSFSLAQAATNCTLFVDEKELATFADEDLQTFKLLGYTLTTNRDDILTGADFVVPTRTCRRPLGIRLCEYSIQIGEVGASGMDVGRPSRGATMMQAILQLPFCSL